jgi:hypothetical protein
MEWFKANIKFTLKTADRYRLLYERRMELKFDSVSNMAEAFRLLSGSPEKPASKKRSATKVAGSRKSAATVAKGKEPESEAETVALSEPLARQ